MNNQAQNKGIQRTDPHRKGAIVPAEYVYVFSFNLPTSHEGHPVRGLGINCETDLSWVERVGEQDVHHVGAHRPSNDCCVLGLRRRGEKFATHGGPGKCTACGASFVYGDVWRHTPTGEHIFLGHDCAAKYGLLADRSAWELEHGRRKQAAAVAAERALRQEERDGFLAKHPGLREDLTVDHHIVRDIADRFQARRSLSDKQVALVRKLAHETRNPAPPEKHVDAPTGRCTFRGRIVSIKDHESQYGITPKLTIKVETPTGSWLAWGTCPRDLEAARGDLIEITATLSHGRDKHFAFYKRPAGARRLEELQ